MIRLHVLFLTDSLLPAYTRKAEFYKDSCACCPEAFSIYFSKCFRKFTVDHALGGYYLGIFLVLTDFPSTQNDQFFISHKHQTDDGLPNLEELQEKERFLDDGASTSSVVRPTRFVSGRHKPQAALFTTEVGRADIIPTGGN